MRFCFDNRKGKERPTEEKKNKINLNKPCSSWIGEKRQKKDGVQYAGDQWLATGVATIEKGVAQRKERK